MPFAAQRFGVTPDLLTFAKAVSNGAVPLGGVLVGVAHLVNLRLNHGHVHDASCAH